MEILRKLGNFLTGQPARPGNRFVGAKRDERETPYKRKKAEPEKINLDRRGFLIKGAMLGGGLVVGGTTAKEVFELAEQWLSKGNPTPNTELEDEAEEQPEVENVNAAPLQEVINFNNPNRIKLGSEVIDEVQRFWHNQYGLGKLRKSFEDAYNNMGEWQVYLKQEFAKEFDQSFANKYGEENRQKALEIIYLAIPESHWQINAVSGAKATGPYQFMRRTAEKYDLKMSGGIDERKDPIKSARACARCIKDIFEVTKDWDLSLSGYNGGFIWHYITAAKADGKHLSYDGFLKWAEGNINLIRDDIKEKQPQLTEQQKERKFNHEISGYLENLNYPAKFNAVIGQIKEGLVKEQEETIIFKSIEIEHHKARTKKYIIRKGETVFGLAKKHHISSEELEAENPALAKRGLKIGEVINIPEPGNQRPTLDIIGRKRGISREHLAKLNPAINMNAPLPDGYKVRV